MYYEVVKCGGNSVYIRKRSIPKHVQIRELLRARIQSEFQPGMRLPPETEFQKALGVSSTTVVRTMNELAREGIIHRRRGSGTFVADRHQPPLIPGRHLKLGILWHHSVVPSEMDTFCGRVTGGILRGLGVTNTDPEYEHEQVASVTRARWSQPARALTVECLGNLLGGATRKPSLNAVAGGGYDGVITIGILEEQWLEALVKTGCPLTIVDFPTQRLCDCADVVYANPQGAFRAAVDAFVGAGLRRIHFVGAMIFDPETREPDPSAPKGVRFARRIDPDSFLRLSAYRQAMDAHGITVPDSWVHFVPTNDTKLPMELARLNVGDRPEALICHEASTGEKLIRECEVLGLNLEAAGGSEKPNAGRVRSICLNSRALGEVAAETMLARLRQPARPYLNIGVRMNLEPAGIPVAASNSAAVHSATL